MSKKFDAQEEVAHNKLYFSCLKEEDPTMYEILTRLKFSSIENLNSILSEFLTSSESIKASLEAIKRHSQDRYNRVVTTLLLDSKKVLSDKLSDIIKAENIEINNDANHI